jgi:hypothetical protein
MPTTIVSPGVVINTNNQTYLSPAPPAPADAAILGPTVKGQVNIPTLVTSYSEYQNIYGDVFTSGSQTYTFLTSVAAYRYFEQGGTSLLVTRVASGSAVAGNWTAATSSISGSFTIETLSEGTIMNSAGAESTNNLLVNGTANNLRWEVTSPNSSSGTFNLLVRQGNDTSKYPSVLETWYNLSLDPFSPNYIERVIGNQVENLASDGGEYYLDLTGSYANNSKYIRIKSVEKLTPNYLDANGNVRIAAFTGSIPTALSGAFGGAFGSNIPASQAANYYENINGSNTQGLVVAGGTVADYTNAINLLSNKDAYQFKYIVAPGINKNQHSNTVTTLLTMVQERGDTMAVVDMEPYGSTVSQTLTDASSLDTSYAATYWPWTQTIDNQTGQPIWTPASTLVPAAYTFSDNASYPWFAPAGTTRGRMSYVTRVERNLTQTNRDNLYVGNVNPLATFPQQGVVIFGQKTLQKQPNALDRVNVRRLLIELINNIGAIANTLVFEQNTQATRNDFLSQVNPYLSSVQQREGVYEFKVVMDESNNTPQTIDNNQLIGQIWIKPTRTAEFISLDFNILPSSATIG